MDIFKKAKANSFKIFLGYFVILLLFGCGGSSSSEGTNPQLSENSAPSLSSASSFTIDENERFSTNVLVDDADGDAFTIELVSSDDSYYFSLEQFSTLVSNVNFDFEFPLDSNQDNIFELEIRISDGKDTTTETILINIIDTDSPLACGEQKTFSITENTLNQKISFEVTKTDGDMYLVQHNGYLTYTQNGVPFEANKFGLIPKPVEVIDDNGASEETAEIKFELISPINAEEFESIESPFTLSIDVSLGEEIITCFASLQVVDIIDEVDSGIKFSGTETNNNDIKTYNVGDINNDGLPELWLSTIFTVKDEPWGHSGYLIDGRSLQKGENQPYGYEFLLESAQDEIILQVSGNYPSLGVIGGVLDLSGYELIPNNMGDLDGDGIDELLITMSLYSDSRNHAFVGRPLAFILWGEALLSEININLNQLSAEQGMTIDWQSDLNRRSNASIALNLDNDGLDDIVISLPRAAIRASENISYLGHTFVLFGDYLKTQKSLGYIDLAKYLSTPQTNQVLVLTTENEVMSIDEVPELPLLSYGGSLLRRLEDLDGDESDELLLGASSNVFGEIYSKDFVILSSKYINSAKAEMDLLLARDIPSDQYEIIRHYGIKGYVGAQQGDLDKDGVNDVLFSSYNFFEELPAAGLISGSDLLTDSNPGPTTIHITDQPITLFNFFNYSNNLNKPVVSGVEFINDIDSDGRDDLVFYTEEFATASLENVSAIVLSSTAIKSLGADQTFDLNNIKAGQGLYIVNASISPNIKSIEYRVVEDIDNDGFDELSVMQFYNSKENFLLLGKVIKQKLDEGASVIDLTKEFRKSD